MLLPYAIIRSYYLITSNPHQDILGHPWAVPNVPGEPPGAFWGNRPKKHELIQMEQLKIPKAKPGGEIMLISSYLNNVI